MLNHKLAPLREFLIGLSIFGHGVWGGLFWHFYRLTADDCSITEAAQMGRLDIISVILAVFGILLAIIAFSWFRYIRLEAKLEAREEISECGERIIRDWLNTNPDVIIKSLQDCKFMQDKINDMASDITSDVANQIAKSMTNTNHHSEDLKNE